MKDPSNQVMYYLSDGPDRAFVSEELMLIPKDTELPPDYVLNWNIYPNWIDIANGSHEHFAWCAVVLSAS